MQNIQCRYCAVVFDLDGVLVDSEPLHLKALELMLARRGIRITPEQAAEQTGITIYQFLDRIVNEWGYPGPKEGENWIDEKRQIFRDRAPQELKPVAGVDDFLRALHGKTKIGLASSSPRDYIDWSIRQFAWEEMFEVVCSVEEVRRPKPDPEMYRLAVERLRVDGGDTLVFEDSPVGIEAAVAAGLNCVGVATSYPAERLMPLGAQRVISDFRETEALVDLLDPE